MAAPRPSPSASATLFAAGHRKRGNDGRMYVVKATAAGVRRWVPAPAPPPVPSGERPKRTVLTMDNGSPAFLVRLFGARAEVLKADPELARERFRQDRGLAASEFDVPVARFAYRRAFVGAGGSSALFETAPGAFTFVGESVFRFRAQRGDTVTSFSSPVGNNGVPYPWATGEANTYFMLGRTYAPNDALRDAAAAMAAAGRPVRDLYNVLLGADLATGAVHRKGDARARSAATRRWRKAHPLAGERELHARLD